MRHYFLYETVRWKCAKSLLTLRSAYVSSLCLPPGSYMKNIINFNTFSHVPSCSLKRQRCGRMDATYISKKKKKILLCWGLSSPQWKETGSGYFEKGPRRPLWSKWAESLLSWEVSFASDLLIGTELVTHCCDLSNIQITCLDFRITGWTLPMHQATRNEAEFRQFWNFHL